MGGGWVDVWDVCMYGWMYGMYVYACIYVCMFRWDVDMDR